MTVSYVWWRMCSLSLSHRPNKEQGLCIYYRSIAQTLSAYPSWWIFSNQMLQNLLKFMYFTASWQCLDRWKSIALVLNYIAAQNFWVPWSLNCQPMLSPLRCLLMSSLHCGTNGSMRHYSIGWMSWIMGGRFDPVGGQWCLAWLG